MHQGWIVFSLRPKLSYYRTKSVQCKCAYRRYSFLARKVFLYQYISHSGCYLLRELSSYCCYFHPGTECALNGKTSSKRERSTTLGQRYRSSAHGPSPSLLSKKVPLKEYLFSITCRYPHLKSTGLLPGRERNL